MTNKERLEELSARVRSLESYIERLVSKADFEYLEGRVDGLIPDFTYKQLYNRNTGKPDKKIIGRYEKRESAYIPYKFSRKPSYNELLDTINNLRAALATLFLLVFLVIGLSIGGIL